jgi:hypothetical protein
MSRPTVTLLDLKRAVSEQDSALRASYEEIERAPSVTVSLAGLQLLALHCTRERIDAPASARPARGFRC